MPQGRIGYAARQAGDVDTLLTAYDEAFAVLVGADVSLSRIEMGDSY